METLSARPAYDTARVNPTPKTQTRLDSIQNRLEEVIAGNHSVILALEVKLQKMGIQGDGPLLPSPNLPDRDKLDPFSRIHELIDKLSMQHAAYAGLVSSVEGI